MTARSAEESEEIEIERPHQRTQAVSKPQKSSTEISGQRVRRYPVKTSLVITQLLSYQEL